MCFKVHEKAVTWSEAKAVCQMEYAVLAELDTIQKILYLEQFVRKNVTSKKCLYKLKKKVCLKLFVSLQACVKGQLGF